MTEMHTPDFNAPDDTSTAWNLTLTNEEQILWHGQAGELNPWNNPLRFLRCAGGTMVNVDHVVLARPCG